MYIYIKMITSQMCSILKTSNGFSLLKKGSVCGGGSISLPLRKIRILSSSSYRYSSMIGAGSALGDIYGGKSKSGFQGLERSDENLFKDLKTGHLSHEKLEALISDPVRAIKLRRKYIYSMSMKSRGSSRGGEELSNMPVEFKDSDVSDSFYSQVNSGNCETVIGFVPVPVGVVGPLVLDGSSYYVPLATTEGSLVSSTNRGARAISLSGGADTAIFQDGMTRAPALQCKSMLDAAEIKTWIDTPTGFKLLQNAFSSTTKHGKLDQISVKLAGRVLYVKLRCTTGDAMGMSLIGKGANEVVIAIIKRFPSVSLMTLSGNLCTDKKPAAVNWIEGRGKSVAAEAIISESIVRDVLKTSVKSIVEVNIAKNLVGSALAGTMGGNNAHASNVVTSIFIATGQDPAQNIESSNCLTFMEETSSGDLRISVTMPCVEVGTVGGGTSLPAQKAALMLLGVAGPHPDSPGSNARQLARIIAGTVLAGELSLMAALSSNHAAAAAASSSSSSSSSSTSSSYRDDSKRFRPKTKVDNSNNGNNSNNMHVAPSRSATNNNKIYNDLNKFLHVDIMSEDIGGGKIESEELLLDQMDNENGEDGDEDHDDNFDKYSRMF